MTRSFFAWLTKPSSGSNAQHHVTSMVTRFHATITMPSSLTSAMGIPSGKTLLHLMLQLHKCKTFKDLGKGGKPPNGYRKICIHLIFDVKHDRCHKSWLVANGHLAEVPLDSIYSGVVSLHGI